MGDVVVVADEREQDAMECPPRSDDDDDTTHQQNKNEDDDSNSNRPHHHRHHRRPSDPLEHANFMARLLFTWAWPILREGLDHPLQEADLPELAVTDTSKHNRSQIDKLLKSIDIDIHIQNENSNDDKNSLFWALARYYFRNTWMAQVLLAISMMARMGQALAIRVLLDHFEQETTTNSNRPAYLSAAIMTVCGLINFLAKQRQFYMLNHYGMQIRIGLIAAIYHKTLRLSSSSSSSDGSASAGQVSNLASNDVERFLNVCIYSPYLICGPLEACAILGVGVSIIGVAFAAGFGLFLAVLLPLQYHLSQRFAKLRSQVASYTDKRVSLVSQVIMGARVVKMNAWELEFEKRIHDCRTEEMNFIEQTCRYKGINEAIYFVSSLLVSALIFMVHVLMGGSLTPGAVYSVLSLMNLLQFSMTKMFPSGIMTVSECLVSSRRLEAFFRLPEIDPLKVESTDGKDDDTAISMVDATYSWEKKTTSNRKPTIAVAHVSADFNTDSFYGILGIVGSGKSALLQALAGELHLQSGTITYRIPTMSFSPQTPWIWNGSIRENILMGLEFEEKWYDKVTSACALDADIQRFQHGDQTLLGSRGVQCSGGQRARIGLARALYRNAKVLLLDDPMSAVDAKVGKHIFNQAIMGLGVSMGRCVILATHQIQFLQSASKCLLVENGTIQANGTFDECVSEAHGAPLSATTEVATTNSDDERLSKTELSKYDGVEKRDGTKEQDGQTEDRHIGQVNFKTYQKYGAAMGSLWVATILLLSFAIVQGMLLWSMAALGVWAEETEAEQDSVKNIATIASFVVVTVVMAIARAILAFHWFNKASRKLHDSMMRSVLLSKISFFDTNPSGRILNRFTADVGIADEQLPLTLYDFSVGIFMALGTLITALVVLPVIFIVLPPLFWYFFRIRRIFTTTARELKRLEGLSRSPIFEMVGEALHGVGTIRSNGATEYFSTKFQQCHDAHTRAYFAFLATSRWFAMRLDVVTFVLMGGTVFSAALVQDQGWFDLDPAVLGLAITLLLQLAGNNFPWIVRQSAEVVNQMISVERMESYAENLPSEAPLNAPSDRNYVDWPKEYSICAKNLTVRYRPRLPLSLEKVSFEIQSGERIGVVGRTGSGKSTLVQSLFRLLEPETGAIIIGGVDISTLGLHKLRSAIAVLPQHPVLFEACTVRENLDPFGTYSEEKIWNALQDVQMKSAIEALPNNLDTEVSAGGLNFSVGQRQLLCLGRAILQESSILILDECTANVDLTTEKLLKEVLRNKFQNSTILAIAHRLDTIADYDRILVLGDGQVLEFGSPDELLSHEQGHFASLFASSKS